MPRSPEHAPHTYRLRIMGALAAALLVAILAVRYWPAGTDEPAPRTYSTRGQDLIQMEEITPTRQAQNLKPPPPAPLPPIVSDEVVMEDIVLDLAENQLTLDEPGEDAEAQEGTTGNEQAAARPQVGPKPVRFVEPEYTREARRKRVRAEVVLEVLVDERGRVQDTRILERFLLGREDDDAKTPVSELGYGLEQAALDAAERWLFRPARDGNTPVRSYTTLTFTFGV